MFENFAKEAQKIKHIIKRRVYKVIKVSIIFYFFSVYSSPLFVQYQYSDSI